MTNLIVCCDGTWNAPDNKDDGVAAPTNVFQLFNAIDLSHSEPKQLSRYQAGVGTGGIIDKVLGGGLGFGLSEDIRDCYQWLCLKYKPGDNIYLFGFSRGAFTARSLAGMINKYGLVKLNDGDDYDEIVKSVYRDGYRDKKPLDDLTFLENSNAVHFIGVWDTVGALGVPDDKSLLNLLDKPENYRFHDTALGENVSHARHAVAIDEKRGSFSPTLWDHQDDPEKLKQIWFPGVHSDVGGGYKESGLANGALLWMMEEAENAGIKFRQGATDQIVANPFDVLHDSHTGAMKVLVTAPRNIPQVDGYENYHTSVQKRRANPPISQPAYFPTVELIDGKAEIDIYAKHPWHWTGIYLEKEKRYRFRARGQWVDSRITCGPAGTNDGKFQFGEIFQLAGSAIGMLENLFKNMGMSEESDFIGTKREEEFDWFALIGAVANQGNPDVDGTPPPPECFLIGEGTDNFSPKESGYLYCFANDAWGFYGNNRGFVTLTVEEC